MAWEPDYVTTAEFKTWARIGDTDDDTALARNITAASRAIDRFCSQHVPRQFGKVDSSESRYYTPRWDSEMARWVVEIDDLHSASDLTVAIDTSNSDTYSQSVTAYVLRPRDALQNKRVYTQIAVSTSSSAQPTYFPDSVQVTSPNWGWSAVPVTVAEATLLQTNRIHKRRTAPMTAAGSAKRSTQVTVNLIEELDPDIETMLQPYVKRGWTM